MASNITNAAAFATANMRPAPDEQIDALWGQNIADNTGYNYFREIPGPTLNSQFETLESFAGLPSPRSRQDRDATMYLTHFREYPKLNGSFILYGTNHTLSGAGGIGTVRATIYLNGVFVYGTDLVGGAGYYAAKGSFVYDKSALTHLTKYEFTTRFQGTFFGGTVGINASLDITTWQSAT